MRNVMQDEWCRISCLLRIYFIFKSFVNSWEIFIRCKENLKMENKVGILWFYMCGLTDLIFRKIGQKLKKKIVQRLNNKTRNFWHFSKKKKITQYIKKKNIKKSANIDKNRFHSFIIEMLLRQFFGTAIYKTEQMFTKTSSWQAQSRLTNRQVDLLNI